MNVSMWSRSSPESKEEKNIKIAWGDGAAVLAGARPDFCPYVLRSGSGSTRVGVEYHLYDQNGDALGGVMESRTGRTGTFQASLEYNLYDRKGNPDDKTLSPHTPNHPQTQNGWIQAKWRHQASDLAFVTS